MDASLSVRKHVQNVVIADVVVVVVVVVVVEIQLRTIPLLWMY